MKARNRLFLVLCLAGALIAPVAAQGSDQDDTLPPLEALAAEADAAIREQKGKIRDRVDAAVNVFRTPRLFKEEEVYAKERDAVARLGAAAVDDLLRHLGATKEKRVIRQLGLILVEIKPRSVTKQLLALATADHGERAITALRVIGAVGDRSALEAVRGLVKSTDRHPVRGAALETLADLRDEESYDLWLTGLKDASITVRTSCVTALGRMGRIRDCDRVIDMLDDPDEKVALAAVTALGNFKSKGLVSLHQLLDHKSPKFVGRALDAIAMVGNRELSKSHLRDLVAATKRPYLQRERAAQILYDMGDTKGMEKLAEPLRRAIRKNPKNTASRRRLGDLYFDFGHWKGAADELEKSVAANAPFSERIAVYEKIARCHSRLGSFKKASDYLVKSGRGNNWSDLAEDADFAEMTKDKKYGKYFQAP